MRVSVIITTYNRHDALLLVLQSIECQTKLPEEVIIADEGSNDNTEAVFVNFKTEKNVYNIDVLFWLTYQNNNILPCILFSNIFNTIYITMLYFQDVFYIWISNRAAFCL